MSQPTVVKSTPAERAPGQQTVVVNKPNWFVRSYRAVGRFFRSGWRSTKSGMGKVGHGLVWAYDYLIARLDLLWGSLVSGVLGSIRWIAGLPMSIIRFFMDTNSETVTREIVEERQLTRRERKIQRQASQRIAEAANRRQNARSRGHIPAHAQV